MAKISTKTPAEVTYVVELSAKEFEMIKTLLGRTCEYEAPGSYALWLQFYHAK